MSSTNEAGAWLRVFRRLRSSPIAWISSGFILFLLLLALLGPTLLRGTAGPDATGDVLAAPSMANPLGTDDVGRSTARMLVLGVRTSLTVGLTAAISSTVVGLLVGAVCGYFGGWLDLALMRVSEIFQVMPTFILAAVVVALAGPGVGKVIFVIAFLSWPQAARLARGEVLRIRSLDFVDAVRCLGERDWTILWHEVVPNAAAPVLALGTLVIGQAILLEAGLAFFGLTTPDVPSWGGMLNTGQRFFYQAWWLSVFPGAAILLTVLAFNLLGDALQAALDPRSNPQ